jgi:hypothetical protein
LKKAAAKTFARAGRAPALPHAPEQKFFAALFFKKAPFR